jgi:hypothetical protein
VWNTQQQQQQQQQQQLPNAHSMAYTSCVYADNCGEVVQLLLLLGVMPGGTRLRVNA